MLDERREAFVEDRVSNVDVDAIARLVSALEEARRENEQLRAGYDTRTEIGQAQGLLMAWLDLDADQAFAYLQRVSSHQNTKLRDVAAEIVRTRQRPAS